MPDFVTRAGWGARAPRYRAAMGTAGRVYLHHTAGSERGYEGMRRIQDFHMGPARGWSDVAYSFVLDPWARIWFEGRGAFAVGAHTSGYNSISLGFCVMGNFEYETPPPTVVDDIKWMLDRMVAQRALAYPRITGPHRDVGQTSCCGNNLVRLIPAMNTPTKESAVPDREPRDWELSARDWAAERGIVDPDSDPLKAPTWAEVLNAMRKHDAYERSQRNREDGDA